METIKLGSRGNTVKTLQRELNLLSDGIFGSLTEEAVKEFQLLNGLKADGIVGQETWSKIFSGCNSVKKSKRVIKEIIVHCSATPEGKDYTVSQIKQWHLSRGFSDIGYHYIIYRDGSIHNGRDVNISGAHCTNHNSNSIGICYIGGCELDGKTPKDTRTEAQKASIIKLLKELKSLYPKVAIHSHSDYSNKACPSFDATKEYSNL